MGSHFGEVSQNNVNSEIVFEKSDYRIRDLMNIQDSNGKIIYEGIKFKKNESLYDIINSFISVPLIPTQELKEFVENGYVTKEELRFKKSMRYTKIALATSIIIGIISILNWVITMYLSMCNV